MSLAEHLVPISFHLRQFNLYPSLDLQAAANGNLTLVGENAVGKTTLANCFFPMLVNGSIATPSFNPEKNFDRLEKQSAPRSSQQDARTFESMLLGWGPGAMKVRTGYVYQVLRSRYRQVILGLGAHRAVGDPRKPTWWFVVLSSDPHAHLNLVTTDEQGQGLDQTEFVAANHELGEQLHVFEQNSEYQRFVAAKIYGFTDSQDLTRLAADYRILASPILTAGNGRFAPILTALKNAQEGIDPNFINTVAETQREVNQTKRKLARIKFAESRLNRLKKQLFWRNLNRINELYLQPFSQLREELDQWRGQAATADQKITKLTKQRTILQPQLVQLEAKIAALQEALAQQNNLQKQRRNCQQTIKTTQALLASAQRQAVLIEKYQQRQAELAQQLITEAEVGQVATTALKQVLARINGRALNLPELTEILTNNTDDIALAPRLAEYLVQQRRRQQEYQALEQSANRANQDVTLVHGMSQEMDQAIDNRAQSPLYTRVREGLHQDNQRIHQHGARRIDQAAQGLRDQQLALAQESADFDYLWQHATIFEQLQAQQSDLQQAADQLAKSQRAQAQLQREQASVNQRLAETRAGLSADYDVPKLQAALADLQQQLAGLVLDQTVAPKLDKALDQRRKLQQQLQALSNQISQQEEKVANAQREVQRLTARTQALTATGQEALQTIAPFDPMEVTLPDLLAAVAFVQQHRSEVRTHPFGKLSEQIRQLLDAPTRQGQDQANNDQALDVIFTELGYETVAAAMRTHGISAGEMTVVAFDLNEALAKLATDMVHVQRALDQRTSNNDLAKRTYLAGATTKIEDQYRLIATYNQMLAQGFTHEQSIKLKVALTPVTVSQALIDEVLSPQTGATSPLLQQEVAQRLNQLANDTEGAADPEAFTARAQELLDTREWSAFKVLIKRRQSAEGDYEEVDNKFVQSGGSGAEKAQAMVLPLLLVPKMILRRARQQDAPYLVMFDEFADKLDPETAKSFAKTIANFGFNFIATMPSGGQNKILADGVDNLVYEVIAPPRRNDGNYYANIVQPALIWRKSEAD
ncbi:SbcC/MukB-like Walker B domain-containing protein [Lapidilactobacillus salsurivasis]